MFTAHELLQLDRKIGSRMVLSIYLSDEAEDPARKTQWLTELSAMIDELERSLGPSEIPEMRRALQWIEQSLASFAGHLTSRGWIGFATPEGLEFSSRCESPMPRLAVWRRGPLIAPAIRELKQNRPVLVLLGDHHESRLIRYERGEMGGIRSMPAKRILHRGTIGASHRSSSRVGMRSETRADAADKARSVAVERMVREVVREIESHRDEEMIFLLGGNAEVVAAIQRGLPARLIPRLRVMPGVGPQTTEAELIRAVEQHASALSAEMQLRRITELVDLTARDGLASLSAERTLRFLSVGAVDQLIVSRTFVRANPSLADQLVRAALEHDGRVDEVGGDAAALLDQHGGVAARLRYAA